jgi:hypothetical protein
VSRRPRLLRSLRCGLNEAGSPDKGAQVVVIIPSFSAALPAESFELPLHFPLPELLRFDCPYCRARNPAMDRIAFA